MFKSLLRLQVNHLSTALLSLLLLPRMEKTGRQFNSRPRVVIVSSEMHFFAKIKQDVITRPKILDRLSEKEYCTSAYVPRPRYTPGRFSAN